MKLFFLLLFLFANGNITSDNGIAYRPLSWNDFRGKVPKSDLDVAAMTTCQMVLSWAQLDDRMTYSVTAYFLPDSSYVRVRSEKNLRHEQTHFQIAYIQALECTQELSESRYRDSATQKEAMRVFSAHSAKRNAENVQFDEDTNHGLDQLAEKDWEVHISQELNNLEGALNKKH